MFIRICFTAAVAILFCAGCIAQVKAVDEKTPFVEKGFEYGYIIKNKQIKTAKGEEFSRYEITLYLSNKTESTKMFALTTALLSFKAPTYWQLLTAAMPMVKDLHQKAPA